ncbi:4-hydroxybutyrate CoA-transferase [bacterium]|nr:4-hydroxybutyrate CoA-transferase [bacterium]
MNWETEYQQKLVSLKEAASIIKSGDVVGLPPGPSAPVDLMNAIGSRYEELDNVKIMSGILMVPQEHLAAKCKGHINHVSVFVGPLERIFMSEGNIEVIPYQFSQTEALFSRDDNSANITLLECSPPDERGYMSFGPMGTFCNDFCAKRSDTLIVQVNDKVPFVYGLNAHIHVSQVDYITECSRNIAELPTAPPGETEQKIASYIVNEIPDGATLQLGLGDVANAIGYMLDDKKDLGIHTEMLTESMVELAEKGVINGSKKTFHEGKILCVFGLGTKKTYDYMHRNLMVETAPVSYVNKIANIAKNDNMISINNTLAVDLTGQVCSETIGFDQYSGTGGQLDFVRGAKNSKGGKSFIALNSTAKTPEGTVSRISCVLPPGTAVTTPRTDVQYVVTEYGIADLWMKSMPNRVRSLIGIAHPDFRDNLEREAREVGII